MGRHDFLRGLTDVIPAFGVSSEDLQACVRGGILPASDACTRLVATATNLISQLHSSKVTSLSGQVSFAASMVSMDEINCEKVCRDALCHVLVMQRDPHNPHHPQCLSVHHIAQQVGVVIVPCEAQVADV